MIQPSTLQLRRIAPRTLAYGGLAIGTIVLFGPLLLPWLDGQVFTSPDLSTYHIPLRFAYQQALRAGDNFQWFPGVEAGVYMQGEGQLGMTHPLHLALYYLLPFTSAFNADLLSSYPIAFAGTLLLFRRLGLRWEAACAGGLFFAFSAFNVLHLVHMNAVAVVAEIPWLLLATDLLLTGTTRLGAVAGFAGVALVIGSQALAGFPQGVYFAALALAWFVLFRWNAMRSRTMLAWVAAACGIGLLIGGVQLLPMLDVTRSSFRHAPPKGFRLTFSMHPLNLLQVLSPYSFREGMYSRNPWEWNRHEFGIYNGAISTLALAWLAVRRRDARHRAAGIGFVVLLIAMTIFALGRNGIVYAVISYLPPLSSWRAPTRHIVLVHFAAAGLVAIMVDDLLRAIEGTGRRYAVEDLRPLFLCVALAVAVSAGLWLVALSPAARELIRLNTGPLALLGPLLFALSCAAIAAAARGSGAALAMLLALGSMDLAYWAIPYAWTTPPEAVSRMLPIQGLPPAARPGDRVHPTILSDANRFVMWDLQADYAYLGINQERFLSPDTGEEQRLAGVRWRFNPEGWAPVTDTMPRARLVTEWRLTQNASRDVLSTDITRIVLVHSDPGATSGPPGTARVLADRPGRIAVETNAPGRQLLVLTDRYHGGWHAAVDGAATPVLRAYGDFMAVPVPAGAHVVAVTFSARSFRLGLRTTAAGVVLLFAAMPLAWRRLR